MSSSPTPEDASQFSPVQNTFAYDSESPPATQDSEGDEEASRFSDAPLDGSPTAEVAITSPTVKVPPKEAAAKFLERFVSTLHWNHSATACRELGSAYVQAFSTWYYKKVGLVKAKSDPNHSPRSCEASVSLQPCKRASEGQAYKALVAEATRVTTGMKITLGKFAIQMEEINNDCRKEDLIDSLAEGLPALATAVLIEEGAEAYGKHNLVADVLMLHHRELLHHHESLNPFIVRYKKVNCCGRAPRDATELYESRFNSPAAESKTDPPEPTINANSPTKQTIPPPDAIAAAHGAPPSTTGKSSSSSVATRNLFPSAATPKQVEPSPTNTSLPGLDNLTIDQLKESYLRFIAFSAKDSPSVAALLQKSPVLLNAATVGTTLLKSSNQSLVLPQGPSTPPQGKQKGPVLSPPQVKWNPYQKKHYFTRKHTQDEIDELCQAVDIAERKLACSNEVQIDSIREENYVNPTEFATIDVRPDSETPPVDFPELSTEIPMESSLELWNDSNFIDKIHIASAALWQRINALYIKAPAVFLNQQVYNRKMDDLVAADSARRKATSASKTVAILQSDKPSTSKIVKSIVSSSVKKATGEVKRKLQSKQDDVLQRLQKLESTMDKDRRKHQKDVDNERRKRQKAEEEVKQLRAELSAKDTRGLSSGASQTNTTIPNPQRETTMPSVTQDIEDSTTQALRSSLAHPSLGGKKVKGKKVRIAAAAAGSGSNNTERNRDRNNKRKHGLGRGRGKMRKPNAERGL